jgi:outer membrane protein assembly factor BamA
MAFHRNSHSPALALWICFTSAFVHEVAQAQAPQTLDPSQSNRSPNDATQVPPVAATEQDDVPRDAAAQADVAPPRGSVERPETSPGGEEPIPSVPAFGSAVDDSGVREARFEEDGHVRYQLERVEVRGNTRTRPTVILRYLPFRPGKALDVDDPEFTLARYRLLGTGFFRDVQFSLRKGSKRGKVVLVVDVSERNTIVLNGVWLGLSADANQRGKQRPLTAYGGIDAAETNLAGRGYTLGGAVGIAQDQYALRVKFLDPGFLGSPWMVNATLIYNHAVDFFGSGNVEFQPTETSALIGASHAVLPYTRFGGSLGFGRDLSVSTQLWFHYRLETVRAEVPFFASQDGRGKVEPIHFDIHQGRSVFSAIRANFQSDTRDHPILPTRGWFVSTWGELGLSPIGSDYDYQRFDLSASRWWKIGGTEHVFRLQGFAGAMAGTVPFFEQYYVGDFSDFLPVRFLGLNVDSRPPSDTLGTAIRSVRYGHYAAEIAAEYRVPIYRGHRSVFGIDFFMRGGLWGLAHQRDLTNPAPAYRGLQQIPVDLTANVGFRMDTSAGGLVFSFANVLGFFPVRGGGS